MTFAHGASDKPIARLEAITAAYREMLGWLSVHVTVVTIDTTRAVP